MGLFLPVVGYVAARRHNPGGEQTEWDKKRRAAVEIFVEGLRTAYIEGRGSVFAPLSKKITENKDNSEKYPTSYEVHPKTYEHRIFFDNDLEKRPAMKEMIDFIMSDPVGGIICVVTNKDLIDASVGQYNSAQCKTVKLMSNIPILECGLISNNGSVINKLTDEHWNSQVITNIAMSALSLRDHHIRRLKVVDIQERFCDMRTKTLSNASDYRAMREAHDAGTLCPDCVTKWASHQNKVNPRAQHIPPHKVA